MKPEQPNGPAQFPTPSEVGPRDWGKEIMLCFAPGHYTFKRIEMTKGSKGGLQFHYRKDEAGYVLSGSMEITYDGGDGSLVHRTVGPGDVFRFPQGSVHKAEALEDTVYLEVSTPFLNDRCHVERHYGIEAEDGGLPSTTLEEVVDL